MVQRQAGDQGLQQLRLARPGGAGDRACGPWRHRSICDGPVARSGPASPRGGPGRATTRRSPSPSSPSRGPDRRGRAAGRGAGSAVPVAAGASARQVAGELRRRPRGGGGRPGHRAVVGRALPAQHADVAGLTGQAQEPRRRSPAGPRRRRPATSVTIPRPGRPAGSPASRGSSGRSTTTHDQPAARRSCPAVRRRPAVRAITCGQPGVQGFVVLARPPRGRRTRTCTAPGSGAATSAPTPVGQPVGVERAGAASTSPGGCRASSWASTPARTPSARSRGPDDGQAAAAPRGRPRRAGAVRAPAPARRRPRSG